MKVQSLGTLRQGILHASIERGKPAILIAKPHRMLTHAYLAFGTNYGIIRNARLMLTNSKFTAYITKKSLGIRPNVLYPPIDVSLIDLVIWRMQ